MITSAIKSRIFKISMLALLAVMVSACGSSLRPTPPIADAPIAQPWGSVPLNTADVEFDQSSTDDFINALLAKREKHRQASGDGKIPYLALTLSGGGSRGAYGAGVLSGWTVQGNRPQFDVVTFSISISSVPFVMLCTLLVSVKANSSMNFTC
jgi:hypothetical protein